MVEEEKKKMTYAGLVIDADEEQLYVLYRAQVYALPMEDEYEDFENGKWVSLIKDGEEIVRAEESQQLEKLNRWNARIVDDELVVDVNVLKRDFDAYPMRKIEKNVEKEDGKRSNLWSYELNNIRDPKNLLGHGDIPAGTFYRCTVSLSMNFDFLPELETNILESDSVEKKLLRILHISPQEFQIYSSKAPWCYLYRADLPPPPLDAGEIESNNMRLGIIARKIIYKDGDVRYFLWSQSTGAIPVVMPRKLNTFKEWRFKVGTIYRFQTRLVGDEICAVRLQPTDDVVPCIVNTTRLFKRTTEDLLIKTYFDLNETRFLSKLEQNHPFFGQLCIEQTDLQQIVENNPDMTSAAGYLKFYFVFNFFEKDESSSCGQWVPVTHQHPAKPTVRREWG